MMSMRSLNNETIAAATTVLNEFQQTLREEDIIGQIFRGQLLKLSEGGSADPLESEILCYAAFCISERLAPNLSESDAAKLAQALATSIDDPMATTKKFSDTYGKTYNLM
jgi:hypothetical protein